MRKIAEVTGTAGTVKVYRDSDWQQYICKLVGNPEADCFTDDRQDALDTAVAMSGYQARPRNWSWG